jgi:hypothetical protein
MQGIDVAFRKDGNYNFAILVIEPENCRPPHILKLEKCVLGMTISDKDSKRSHCETCLLGKMTNYRNRYPDERAKGPLNLVHMDLAGPIDPASGDNLKYALVCVDDYTGLVVVYFLKQKLDTADAFRKFLTDIGPFGKVKKV